MRTRQRLSHAYALVVLSIVMGGIWFLLMGAHPTYAAGGAIDGTVTNDAGQPLANIGVYLYIDPNGSGYWEPTGLYGVTDESGQYTITDLAPNDYRLQFQDGSWPLTYATEYYNNVLRLDAATTVTVGEGQTVTADAQLSSASRIEGIVTDSNDQPIGGIQASLWVSNEANPNSWGPSGLHATTDSNGVYSFPGVDTGRYRLSFTDTRSPHFYSTEYYDNSTLAQATDIVVPGITPRVINAQLAGVGTVTGRITNAAGQPLPGITVQAASDPEGDSIWDNSLYWPSNATNAAGIYTLVGVEVGPTLICFSDYSYQYADECYDNVPLFTQANIITVTAGATMTINAELAQRGGISGRVTDAAGTPLRFYKVLLYIDLEDNGRWIADAIRWTYTNEAGVYSFNHLNPDAYRIQFVDQGQVNASEFYRDALTIEEATDVVVLPGKITPNIDAQVEPFSHITGIVTNQQNQPLEKIRVSVYGMAPNADTLPSPTPLHSTYTDINGAYNLTGLRPGQYYVGFADTYNHVLHTEYYNDAGYLMTADSITVGRVMTVTGINAQLQPFAAINYPPFVTSDTAYVLKGGTTKMIRMPRGLGWSVLNNDQDAESDLTATLVTSPTHGSLTLAANGMFTYTHDASETTRDFFTYRAFDGVHYSPITTVTVEIMPVFLAFTQTVWIAGLPAPCGITNNLRVPGKTTVAYCYTVRNSGIMTATQHTLVDDQPGSIYTTLPYTLAPGATHSIIMTQTIAVTTTSVATWTAVAPHMTLVLSATAVSTTTVTLSLPTDDQDQDSIPDMEELVGDIDHDNLPNFLDPDADGDSVPDRVEVGNDFRTPRDSNRDGVPDYLDPFTPYSKRLYLSFAGR